MFLPAVLCSAGSPALGASTGQATVAEQYLLAAANQEREARGLQPLHRDPLLARAAERHAELMAQYGSISHQFPGEAALTNRGADAGVTFSLIEENVAEAPNAVQIHEMWMNSEHHRENLLSPEVDAAGISVVARNGQLYAVEDFARTVHSVSLSGQEAAIASLLRQTAAAITIERNPDEVAAARQTCAMDSGYAGPRRPWFVMRFTSDTLTRLPSELTSRLSSGRYRQAAVGACAASSSGPFTSYNIAVLLYP